MSSSPIYSRLPIETMHLPSIIQEKSLYCEHWIKDAESLHAQGCYDWMAKHTLSRSRRRILDIGCGTGQGLASLLKTSARSIVSIEENFACLLAAAENIKSLGFPPKICQRMGYVEHPDGTHDLRVNIDEAIIEGSLVTLIHGDVLLLEGDPVLNKYLHSARKFDAITVWLTGTVEMRKTCRAMVSFKFKNPGEYRYDVHHSVFKIADNALKPGGILHIVDRGLVPDSEYLKEEAIKPHLEHSQGTSLVHSDSEFDFIEFQESTGKGITLVRHSGNHSVPDDGRRAMHSIVFKKW